MEGERLLRDLREELSRADAKASTLFAAFGVVLGALLAGLLANSWAPSDLDNRVEWLWWAGALVSALAPICLGAAIYPRMRRGWSPDKHVAYFGDFVTLSRDEVGAALASNTAAWVPDQVLHLAKLVRTKYRLLQWGMCCMAVGLVLCLSAVAISALIE